MGLIINIDEALKLRSEYNVLKEPLHQLMRDRVEAWEQENPLDLLYNRGTISSFQETYTSSIGFDHAFTETSDYAVGPIFNTAEGFAATYRTRTFQGSFIITQQAMEDRQVGNVKETATMFLKRWHGDTVEYGMAAMQGAFGKEYIWKGGDGKLSRLRLTSADTVTGDIDSSAAGNGNNPLFSTEHTIVKREGMTSADIAAAYQSNIFGAELNPFGDDPARISKLADIINQVITNEENYRDDNNKIAGVSGSKMIVSGNDAQVKAAINTAISMQSFCQGDTEFPNPAYQRATYKTTPYLNELPCCKRTANGFGFFIVDKAYNAENHGPEFTERIPLTLEAIWEKRPAGVVYDGRQRFDINVASWRGIAYVYVGTLGTSGSDKTTNWTGFDNVKVTELTPVATVVKPVTVVGTVATKEQE